PAGESLQSRYGADGSLDAADDGRSRSAHRPALRDGGRDSIVTSFHSRIAESGDPLDVSLAPPEPPPRFAGGERDRGVDNAARRRVAARAQRRRTANEGSRIQSRRSVRRLDRVTGKGLRYASGSTCVLRGAHGACPCRRRRANGNDGRGCAADAELPDRGTAI